MFITVETVEKKYVINCQDISYIEPIQSAVFTGVRIFLRTRKPGGDYPMAFEVSATLEEIIEQLEDAKINKRYR